LTAATLRVMGGDCWASRGSAESRRRRRDEKSFRKMGGRAFLEIVGAVLRSIPD